MSINKFFFNRFSFQILKKCSSLLRRIGEKSMRKIKESASSVEAVMPLLKEKN